VEEKKHTDVDFIVGSNLRNPLISVICGSDNEECQKHRFNGYVDELRGAEDAEAYRGNLGMIFSILVWGNKKAASHETQRLLRNDYYFILRVLGALAGKNLMIK